MSDEKAITGKVAEVISDREVILNKGSADGVREGMYFKILDPNAFNVVDPDTNEVLGGLKRVKVALVAKQVAERLTLATTFRTTTVNIGGNLNTGFESVARSLTAPRYVERVERLRYDPNAARPISEKDSIVAKGDPFESTDQTSAETIESVAVSE